LTGTAQKRHYQGQMIKDTTGPKSLQDLLRLVEASGLHDHPNPERIGCLSEDSLEAFARDPGAFSIDGPEFIHLSQCSPCFQFVHDRIEARLQKTRW